MRAQSRRAFIAGAAALAAAAWLPRRTARKTRRQNLFSLHRRRAAAAEGQFGAGAGHCLERRGVRDRLWQRCSPPTRFRRRALTRLRHVSSRHHHSDHNADYGNLIWLAWTAGLRTRAMRGASLGECAVRMIRVIAINTPHSQHEAGYASRPQPGGPCSQRSDCRNRRCGPKVVRDEDVPQPGQRHAGEKRVGGLHRCHNRSRTPRVRDNDLRRREWPSAAAALRRSKENKFWSSRLRRGAKRSHAAAASAAAPAMNARRLCALMKITPGPGQRHRELLAPKDLPVRVTGPKYTGESNASEKENLD